MYGIIEKKPCEQVWDKLWNSKEIRFILDLLDLLSQGKKMMKRVIGSYEEKAFSFSFKTD